MVPREGWWLWLQDHIKGQRMQLLSVNQKCLDGVTAAKSKSDHRVGQLRRRKIWSEDMTTAKEKKCSQGMAVTRAKMLKESCNCQRAKMLPQLLFSQDKNKEVRMSVKNDNYKSKWQSQWMTQSDKHNQIQRKRWLIRVSIFCLRELSSGIVTKDVDEDGTTLISLKYYS